MVQNDRRITIITGHYGSGKTEFAVNYSVKLSQISPKVTLGDLDIVNVYFRSRERKAQLQEMGIHVISSSIEGDSVDIPAVAAITSPVRDKSTRYIVDLGGNDTGTMVLGRIKPLLDLSETDFFMVVNTNRPNTSSPEGIIKEMKSIEGASGLKVTGFVNNTNLIRETTAENIAMGDKILKEASRLSGVPIKYTTYVEEVLHEPLPEGLSGELFPMKFYMRKDWM
ncbi:MAG TPA: ATP-binding protein [Candidatus Coprocola pullicola]|nr:ATP-binding protein [Candidatus Coprocola pullicola]